MSRTNPVMAVVVALGEALKRTGRPNWVGVTPDQKRFLELIFDYEISLGRYDKWVKGFAADTAAEINAWLAAQGFDITLGDWPADGWSFGVAGITNVLVNWAVPGTVSKIEVDSMNYPAFTMKLSPISAVILTGLGSEPVVELKTKEGLVVRIQMGDDPESPLGLQEASLELHRAKLSRPLYDFTEARIPMVSLDDRPDVGWLLGMRIPAGGSEYWELVQGVAQTKFGMNEHGARAKEAFAGQVTLRGIERTETFEVNGPFRLTIGDLDAHAPIFGAWINQSDWRNPGDLSKI